RLGAISLRSLGSDRWRQTLEKRARATPNRTARGSQARPASKTPTSRQDAGNEWNQGQKPLAPAAWRLLFCRTVPSSDSKTVDPHVRTLTTSPDSGFL